MIILEITEFSQPVLEAVNLLLPQLSKSASALDEKSLIDIINHEATHLLMAVEDGKYYGMLTLVKFPIPTGFRVWIEDVVVSEDARKKGVGRMLSEHAIAMAKSLGARTIDLTSRPSRSEANKLYQAVGFMKRQTNVYRYQAT